MNGRMPFTNQRPPTRYINPTYNFVVLVDDNNNLYRQNDIKRPLLY